MALTIQRAQLHLTALPQAATIEIPELVRATPRDSVSSHNFNSQIVKLRVSNPRTIAYVHFKMLKCSNLPGAGPIFPDQTFEDQLHASVTQG